MTMRHDQILYAGPLITIGQFDCPRHAPDFNNTGPIHGHLLAFPQTAVKIRHDNMREAFVADTNTVTIYNAGQAYERLPLSDYGDRCDWLAICPELLCEVLSSLGITYSDDPKKIFRLSHGISSVNSYASFRKLITRLKAGSTHDNVVTEETALTILCETIAKTHLQKNVISTTKKRLSTQLKHAKLTQTCIELLSTCHNEPLSLSEISRELNTSAFHLCRVFKRQMGSTIHQYINQLRLRDALSGIAETDTDFATLSVNLGFSDHSHFSQTFRKTFGESPSSYRRYMRLMGSTKSNKH